MQNWFDNLPESLQGADKGQDIEGTVSQLEDLQGELENLDFDSIAFPSAF